MYLKTKQYLPFVYTIRQRWEDFGNAYWLFGREAELQRLITWASKKRLAKPRQAYQNRLAGTQIVLARIQMRSPQLWEIARLSFEVMDWLFPPPQYMLKGSAGRYRRNRLTSR